MKDLPIHSSPSETPANKGTHAGTGDQPVTFKPVSVPAVELPKGGGAIRGIDEKFSINAINGTAGCSIPVPVSAARGFGIDHSLNYDSGQGNGIFGLGWTLSLPSIKRKTEKELPQYFDAIDSDTYMLTGAEDLVPEFKTDNAGDLIPDGKGGFQILEMDSPDTLFRVRRYRPRVEGSFSRIERWTEKATGSMHWRVISKKNVTALYGQTAAARIADPANVQHIFEWFLEFTYDDRGNAALYEYKPEDVAGLPAISLHNRNRLNGNTLFVNTYLKRIRTGNIQPYKRHGDPRPASFMFETVFDYGELDPVNLPFNETSVWAFRPDPFSNYRPGFEVRTCRRCSRILLYHHFDELPGKSALVKSLDLSYTDNGEDGFTFLAGAALTGYTKHDDGAYTSLDSPPVSFDYQQHSWNFTVQTLSPEQVINAPAGIDNKHYQWVDLYSEGLSGILSEQGGTWFYKSNWGAGHFSPATAVLEKPNFMGLASELQLVDLESNGAKQLVSWQKEPKGFFELNPEEHWSPFHAFSSVPVLDLKDPNTRLLDLDGDGRPDLLITDQEVFTWWPSKGKQGFGESRRVFNAYDEEKKPALVFSDELQTIFLADMSGDGLTDLVRIRNGELCYWPNLGYGRFGAKISMDNAPVFDRDEAFNPVYLQLADIDGSGTTDLLYLGQNQCRIWLNRHGNAFSPAPRTFGSFPTIDDTTKLNVIDLLGTGLSCIVWSSPLPGDRSAPLRYLDLMNSTKPHVLIGYQNNLGMEVSLQYAPSTKFYIEDKLNGAPWVTKLHFPMHCVSKVVTIDRIRKSRLVSQYSFHHGYYDPEEREFRGFGRVDKVDSEDLAHFLLDEGTHKVLEKDLLQDPIRTKTWFHTGAFIGSDRIMSQFAHEYFQNTSFPENLLPEPKLPDSLTPDDLRQAVRACKGQALRKEIYALDSSALAGNPYVVEQHNGTIIALQPTGQNKYGVFLVHESEAIIYTYERNPKDPQVMHQFVLEVDKFGNIVQQASVTYGRRPAPGNEPEQEKTYITFTENAFTKDVLEPLDYRPRTAYSSQLYEVTGLPIPTGYFQLDALKADCNTAAFLDYDKPPTAGKQRRLLSFFRAQFRADDGLTDLPFGDMETKGLIHQTYEACFNSGMLNLFAPKISPAALAPVLTDPTQGGYIFQDNYYWAPSGVQNYDPDHFFVSTFITDAFGNSTTVEYDPGYFLYVRKITDALGNVTSVTGFNYRVLSPYLLQDMNDNAMAVRFDEMGLVVRGFTIGKKGVDAGDAFDDTKVELKGAVDFPGRELTYSKWEWYDQRHAAGFDPATYKPQPNYIRSRARETHYNADPAHAAKFQESVAYSDGNGQLILTKTLAEPGPALQVNPDGTVTPIANTAPNPRWAGNGRVILNNKGNPIKKYESYFSVLPSFDDESEMVQLGVTSLLYYDPADRNIRTVLPDKTFTKVEFNAWEQVSWDNNDTVRDSDWYLALGSPDPTGPEPADPLVRAAWLAAHHAGTPTVAKLDSLGRIFLTISDTATEKISVRTRYDIGGNSLATTDGLGRIVITQAYDMKSTLWLQSSLDAGSSWLIQDASGKSLLSWDDRSHAFRFRYDALRRITDSFFREGAGAEQLYASVEYGETVAGAKSRNVKGAIYRNHDQSGVRTTEALDFKGNQLQSTKQLAFNYKTVLDWAGAVPLETEVFQTLTEYDALNRPIRLVTPHSPAMSPSDILPLYNEAGLLDSVDVIIRGVATRKPFVTNINYNARRQREEIFYGNNTTTKYTYDPNNFLLVRLLTTRNAGVDILQDIRYTYDPAGNMTELTDKAIADVFFDGEAVKAISKFTYDATYRLTNASGRKHAGQTDPQPKATLPGNTNFANMPFRNSPVIDANDAAAFRNYSEQYQYDKAGNLLQQQHLAKNSGWTRTFIYDNGSNGNNRLTSTSIGGDTYNYTYDAHGNMHGLETVLSEIWNFLDHFTQADLGGGGNVYYVYDAGGERCRKVIERQDGTKKQRIYLGGVEIYREMDSGGNITLARETLHVMDGQQRLAMVDTPVTRPAGNTETELIRYQYSNHLGSAALELDDTARTISYEEYFPFGTSAFSTIDATREISAKRYRYTGKERDEETGLNYHGARYYALWLCRWTAADPLGVKNGLNIYLYVNNNPIRLHDPNGKEQNASDMDRNNPNNYATFEEFSNNAIGPLSDEALKQMWDEAHPEPSVGQMTGSKGTSSVGKVPPSASEAAKPKDETPAVHQPPEYLPSFTFRPKIGDGMYGNAVPCQAMHCHQPGIMNAGNGPSFNDVGVFLVKNMVIAPVEAVLGDNTANAPSTEDVEKGRVVNSTSETQKLADSAVFFAFFYADRLVPIKLKLPGSSEPIALAKGTFTGVVKNEFGAVVADDAATYLGRTTAKAGRFDYAIHGNPEGFWITDRAGNWIKLSPERVAEMMKLDGYTGGPVRLLSCEAGACVPGVRLNPAQRLANILDEPVLAPTNKLWVDQTGKLVVGPKWEKPLGEWVWHKPE